MKRNRLLITIGGLLWFVIITGCGMSSTRLDAFAKKEAGPDVATWSAVMPSATSPHATVTPTQTPIPIGTSTPTLSATRTIAPTGTDIPTLTPTDDPLLIRKNPCVSYYDQTLGALKFACLRDGNWDIQIVDNIGNVGKYSSLAFDRHAHAHISYFDETNSVLKYAAWDGANWRIQFVDIDGEVGQYTSLALDYSGSPAISYFDVAHSAIKLAWLTGDTWQIRMVKTVFLAADDDEGISETSLLFDTEGNPLIGYLDSSVSASKDSGDASLRLSSWQDGLWGVEIVIPSLTAVSGFLDFSLALDSQGNPGLSYIHNANLFFGSWTGSEWELQNLDNTENVGAYNSLAFDKDDHPHISYFDETSANLKCTIWDGKKWGTHNVDVRGNTGRFTSIAIDHNDTPYIAYFDDTNGDLKIAYYSGDWHYQIVDSEGVVGLYTSLDFEPGY